jgi:uncharacterized protein (DUF433 family)
MNHMRETESVQRSFRMARRTVELLDQTAAATGESRNALVDRLLGEGVRLERHPLVRFHAGTSGRRQPALVGTRLAVHQVVATVRAERSDVDAAADYLAIEPSLVRAAVDYYADFRDEVDADAAFADRVANDERARWERRERALA